MDLGSSSMRDAVSIVVVLVRCFRLSPLDEIVSFFFPFPLSFILYIGDNVDFKYGGGERHLHCMSLKRKISKSYNLHLHIIFYFVESLFLTFVYFLCHISPI